MSRAISKGEDGDHQVDQDLRGDNAHQIGDWGQRRARCGASGVEIAHAANLRRERRGLVQPSASTFRSLPSGAMTRTRPSARLERIGHSN